MLEGRTFVLTGTLENLSRQEAKDSIQDAGGVIRASLNIQTDFLVAGKNPGSKAIKAKSLGVQIIDESELLIYTPIEIQQLKLPINFNKPCIAS